MTMTGLRVLATAAVVAAGLGACNRTPEGQVVATVNGEEITRRDLQAEFAAAGGANADDLTTLQPALVQSIVNRKLLVQEAQRTDLDKSPQYLAARQRGEEALLAQMLTQTWSGRVAAPRPADAPAFVAQNPLMFAERKLLQTDSITTSADSIPPAQLRALTSNDAIAAWLTQNQKPFRRGDRTLDTLALPADLAGQLVANIGKGPVAINSGGVYSIVQIRAVRDAPVPQNEWPRVAQAAMVQRRQAEAGESQLRRLRDSAEINYLPGFAPKEVPAAGKAAAPASPAG